MKRFLGFMVAVVACLPFVVSAKDKLDYRCTSPDDGDTYNCTVSVILEGPADQLTFTLTERGGAEITTIEDSSEDWDLNKSENDGVYTISLLSSDLNPLEGEFELIKFNYASSGTDECEVALNFKEANYTPETPSNPDSPGEQKPTGATLPYIALGVIALGAIGAYLGTKNKSKMYRI